MSKPVKLESLAVEMAERASLGIVSGKHDVRVKDWVGLFHKPRNRCAFRIGITHQYSATKNAADDSAVLPLMFWACVARWHMFK